ncbi:MAG: PhnD/SsuA/transferrin family substrate-binding protein [Pseudomonadota bacterium]
MIASLPMYLRTENKGEHRDLWAGFRDVFGSGAPAVLSEPQTLEDHWSDSDLFLSQTCGLPYRAGLHEKVTLVGLPDYGLPGVKPGFYFSVLVARRGDPRRTLAEFEGAGLAVNDTLSQSGWAAPQEAARAAGLAAFGVGALTGSHRASAIAVAEGTADLAAIDAVTWRLITQWDAVAPTLKVVAKTSPTPGLPMITARNRDPVPIAEALRQVIGDLAADVRLRLGGLRKLVPVEPNAYLSMPMPPFPSAVR